MKEKRGGAFMQEEILTISEVAKSVTVENHVLRYWEEELGLEIKRNKNGHRYYTKENVEEFVRIKEMKEKGLQLKAIRMVLFQTTVEKPMAETMGLVAKKEIIEQKRESVQEDKIAKIERLLKQIIQEAVKENNQQLCEEVKASVVKELDYQFRLRDEVEQEREQERVKREEEHYKKIDEAIRGKMEKKGKRKKHPIF